MRKQVYFDEARRGALADRLAEAAATITATGELFREHFPGLAWNTRALWVLAFEPGARAHYCKEILEREAEASKLPCDWDRPDNTDPKPRDIAGFIYNPRPEPLSEEIRLNRKFVEIRTRELRGKIQALGGIPFLEDFLRAGVLSIGKDGETLTAKDAEVRLDDFCTLFAEDKQQAAFVEAVERMRAAALALAEASQDAAKAAQGAPGAPLLSNCAGDYAPARLELLAEPRTGYGYDAIRLLDPEAVPRALITAFDLERKERKPKFYNRAGAWAYTREEAEAAAGCSLPELAPKRQLPPGKFCPRLVSFG